MPIVEAAGSGPLRQGDILTNLVFYTTGDNGPLAGKRTVPYSVVISRDCKALRADTILVAEIQAYNQAEVFKEILSGERTFEEARRILGTLRDGDGSPDTCYLGPLRDDEERFAVKLDRIHCVAVPDEGDKRLKWIESHRVLRLTPDFIRHLQVKLFASIVKQGFDDYAWWPIQDLAALVLVGRNELNKLLAENSTAELALKSAEAANSKQAVIDNHRAAVSNGRAKAEALTKALQPYKDELDRRGLADGDVPPPQGSTDS